MLAVLTVPPLSQAAAAAAQALEDLVDAVGEVKALQERTVQADRSALIDVSVQVTSATELPSVASGCASFASFTNLLFLALKALFPEHTVTCWCLLIG